MTFYLDQAQHASSDPLEVPTIQLAHIVPTGRRGQPRVEIDPNLLSTALGLRMKTQIAKTANCSAHTICRRQLEHGIYVSRPNHSQTQQAGRNGGVALLSWEIGDEELDWCLSIVMQDFPTFGRQLATASLRANGVMVSESRVRDSLTRISGVPGTFGGRRVHHRRYQVAGANSLWHHDGQHGIWSPHSPSTHNTYTSTGLIRWKIVIHGFIDGKSRLVVGIQAHDNNRTDTVLNSSLMPPLSMEHQAD